MILTAHSVHEQNVILRIVLRENWRIKALAIAAIWQAISIFSAVSDFRFEAFGVVLSRKYL